MDNLGDATGKEHVPNASEPELLTAPGVARLPSQEPMSPYSQAEAGHPKGHRLRRALGSVAAVATLTTSGAVGGAILKPAEATLGPHKANITLTFDSYVTYDFGPFDSLRSQPVDWLMGSGVNIEIKGSKDKAESDPAKQGFTDEIVQKYARFFANHERDSKKAKAAVVEHMAWSAIWTDAAGLGLFLTLGKRRRQELWENRRLRASLASAMLVCALSGPPMPTKATDFVPVSDTFDDTPLENFSMRGDLLPGLLNDYVTRVIGYFERDDQFFDEAVNNLRLAQQQTPTIASDESTQLILVYGGRKCNSGMARVIGEAAKKVDLLISTGDEAIGGTPIDNMCMGDVPSHTKGKAKVMSPGNHDTDDAIAEARKNGFNVLDDGKVQEIEDLRMLGDDETRISNIGEPIRQDQSETVEQMASRLAEEACSDEEGVDILGVNQSAAGLEALRRGCVKLMLSGTSGTSGVTRVVGPDGKVVWDYRVASAGGAGDNALTIGPLQNTAEFTIFRVSEEEIIAYQIYKVHPDASVTIDPIVELKTLEPQTTTTVPG